MKFSQVTRVLVGLVVTLCGLVIVGTSLVNLTVAEDQASQEQQRAAEVEPLTVADSPSQLQIGEVFAKIRIPRFGEDYVRNVAEGTNLQKVLNTVGIGHYTSSQMPGEVGNFALAGPRAGNGGPMRLIDKFQAGDQVTVETATGTFTYRYLESKIVSPETVGVVMPVPEGLTGAVATGKYLTLTTCTPIYINTERYVAWFELID